MAARRRLTACLAVVDPAKAVVEAPQIELVENATHPVVFGENSFSINGHKKATTP